MLINAGFLACTQLQTGIFAVTVQTPKFIVNQAYPNSGDLGDSCNFLSFCFQVL